MTVARAAVVREALSWQGTPYHSGACLKGVGADCATLLIGVYAAVGAVKEFDPGYYPPDWHLHSGIERYLAVVAKHGKQVEAALPGDIAVWKFGRLFSHGAIVIDWPKIIHAVVGVGVILGEGHAAILTHTKLGEPRPVQFWSLWG